MSYSHCIFFSSINTGWVSGNNGVMYKTTNGGFNWYQQNTTTVSFLQSVYFVTDSIGWAVGGGGRIIHTTTGGLIVGENNQNAQIPEENILYQNYPNPFNPLTKIRYAIPFNGFVTIKIYNTTGQEISTLVNNEYKNAGYYYTLFDGTNLSSGVYFYKFEAGNYYETKKMILIK